MIFVIYASQLAQYLTTNTHFITHDLASLYLLGLTTTTRSISVGGSTNARRIGVRRIRWSNEELTTQTYLLSYDRQHFERLHPLCATRSKTPSIIPMSGTATVTVRFACALYTRSRRRPARLLTRGISPLKFPRSCFSLTSLGSICFSTSSHAAAPGDSTLRDFLYQSICRCYHFDAGLAREHAPLDDGICKSFRDRPSGAGSGYTR